MKKIFLLLSIVFLFMSNLYASGGSLYTRFGLGDLYQTHSALQLGFGGIGTSFYSSKFVNTSNPASISRIQHTRFGAGVASYSSKLDDGLLDAVYSHVKFSGFHIAFPIERDLGIGFMLGMTPYSLVNYDVSSSSSGLEGNREEKFVGNGGISKVFFGTSIFLPGNITFGATFNYLTGNITHESQYIYADSLNLFDSNFIDESKYKGLGGTFGLMSPNLSNIVNIEAISDLRVGISYEYYAPVKTDTVLKALTTIGENSLESGGIKTNIPSKIGIGFSFTLKNILVINFDYIYQPWSKYEKNGVKLLNLRDLTRYNIGFEYGDQEKRFATFWELIKYRGGLSYEQSQYEINGEGINQFGIHAGISVPLGLDNSIDIGLMYGMRGTTDNNLVKENILQASFSLNFGEFWFIRQER